MLMMTTFASNNESPIASSSSSEADRTRVSYSFASDAHCVKVEAGTPLLTVTDSFDSLLLSPDADQSRTNPFPNPMLISPSPSFRPLPPAALQPARAHLNSPVSTLLPNFRHLPTLNRFQDVVHSQLNPSLPYDQPEPISQYGQSSRPVHSLSSTPSQHDSINTFVNRPRTSPHPVFTTPSALAAHHGIPQSLPPVPRTTRFTSDLPASSAPSTANTDFDFNSLCSNYLTMLSQKPEECSTTTVVPTAPVSADADAAAVQALMEVIQASPEFQMAQDFGSGEYNEFLTSPLDDSPWEDFLTTPALGTDGAVFTSPAIADADDFGDFGNLPLFGDGLSHSGVTVDPLKSAAAPPAPALPSFNFDGMYTMPSPNTPSLDPSSLHPSPRSNPIPPPPTSTPAPQYRRRSTPTGTRKNLTPESLVPFDAPIQMRKYVTPSATSRKEVPAVFLKKRSRTAAFGKDEEDQIVEDPSALPPSPNELDAIEAKRRQNTLAARRSRKRKLEYQRELEEGMEREREEKEAWKSRAMMYEALLKSHGVEVPSFS